MKILFVSADLFYSEPLGLMMLSSIAKKMGHDTSLLVIKKDDIIEKLNDYKPDLVAYSAMTADIQLFVQANMVITEWSSRNNPSLVRIMGGAHATFFPEIKDELKLDAVCVGEGDLALQSILNCISSNKPIQLIPNVIGSGENLEQMKKELISDLDQFPYADRNIFYDSRPIYRNFRLRSFLTARGCPFHCTYCHNYAYNKMFQGCGKIVRKHSIEYVIDEIKHTIKSYPPVSMIRFADDTFAYKMDEWLIQFLKRYKNEINLPFYCLMRSNTLTEDMAKLLSEAGCCSISMSLESGIESVRNEILKRELSDHTVLKSFEYAKKFRIKIQGNTMMALPGGSLGNDLKSYMFAKKLNITLPTFGIFMPYPKTELTDYAIMLGQLDAKQIADRSFSHDKSILNAYTEKEKDIQYNIMYLGSVFCNAPDLLQPMFRLLIRFPSNFLYKFIGRSYVLYKFFKDIFPGVISTNPFIQLRFYFDSISYLLLTRIK